MMTVLVSKNMDQFSPSKAEECVPKATEEQGIVSNLGSDCRRAKAASASLKRTLSADMSSKNWSAENRFSSPVKKIASHEQLAISAADSSSSFDVEEDYEETKDELNRQSQSEIWMSIQSEKKDREFGTPGQSDIWSSILSQKADEPSKLPPPYIHPLVKRSSSSLSEKSLEICTESLGSETGSDGFSSYAPSEAGDVEDKELKQQQNNFQSFDKEEIQIPKYNYYYKKSTPRSLPSSTSGRTGPCVQMHSYREDGRLVLEAIPASPQNSFQSRRQDGHLLLTLVSNQEEEESTHDEMEDEVEEFEQVLDKFEKGERDKVEEEDQEIEEHEEEEKIYLKGNEMVFLMGQAPELTSRVINVQGTTLMMKKLMSSDNIKCIWPPKFNKSINLVELEVEEEEEEELRRSLPPLPRVSRLIPPASSPQPTPTTPASAALINAYEYLWRTKPVVASIINPITKQCATLKNSCNKDILPNSQKMHKQQELVIMRGNRVNYLVPLLKGCKEPRRPLLIWEPFCIAT